MERKYYCPKGGKELMLNSNESGASASSDSSALIRAEGVLGAVPTENSELSSETADSKSEGAVSVSEGDSPS